MPSTQDFQSKIPEHLLQNETPAMQFLMNELSKNTQATEYLLMRREESGEILESINKKLDYTNGSIAEAKRDIFDLQEKSKKQESIAEDLNQIVFAKRIACKLAASKIFWIVFGAAVIGLLTIFTDVPLSEFLPFLRK